MFTLVNTPLRKQVIIIISRELEDELMREQREKRRTKLCEMPNVPSEMREILNEKVRKIIIKQKEIMKNKHEARKLHTFSYGDASKISKIFYKIVHDSIKMNLFNHSSGNESISATDDGASALYGTERASHRNLGPEGTNVFFS